MAVANVVLKVQGQMSQLDRDMAKTTTLIGDFGKNFDNAAKTVSKAQGQINEAFSGQKAIQAAAALVTQVEKLGGATKLTASEQSRANTIIQQALDKYAAMGLQAPAALQKIAQETKNVSTFAERAGGFLKSTFATFTAAGLATTAITKLVGGVSQFAAAGAKFPGLEASFQRLTRGIGVNAAEMRARMQDATQGLVSDLDLVQSANKAMLLGLPVTAASMGDLAKTATILGKAMGQDATASLNDLITALGRSSPMILDNLGLTVKVGEANEAYAAKLGKSADKLTEAEQKMAFYNAAMEAARQKTAELGEQTRTLGELAAAAWTSFGNVVTRTAASINTDVGNILSDLANIQRFGFAKAGDLARTVINREQFGPLTTVTPGVTGVDPEQEAERIKKLKAATEAAAEAAKKYAAAVATLSSELSGSKLRGEVMLLQGAVSRLSAEQLRQPAVLDRVGDAVERLRQQGATLTTELTNLAIKSGAFAETVRIVTPGISGITSIGRDLTPVLQQNADAFSALSKAMNPELTFVPINQVAAATPTVLAPVADKVQRLTLSFDDLARSLAQLSDVAGPFGGILRGLATMVTAFDTAQKSLKALQDGFKAFASGAQVAGLGSIAGALGAIAAAGVTAGKALQPLLGLNRGKLGALLGTNNQGRNNVEAFTASMGGFEALRRKLDQLGAEGERMWRRLTQLPKNSDTAAAAAAIRTVTDALDVQARKIEDTKGKVGDLIAAHLGGGTTIPPALQLSIDKLITMGRLTGENAAGLLGLTDTAVPAFADVKAAADRLGLSMTGIGERIAQMPLTETATQVVDALDTLRDAGADMGAVLAQSTDSVQPLVTEALRFGRELPDSMRPYIESMVEAGLLTDLSGSKLRDLKGIEFAEPLSQKFDDLIAKIGELVDALSGTGGIRGALDDLADQRVRIPIRFDVEPLEFPEGAGPTRHFGHGGVVDRPTLAMVGERGPELITPLSGAQLGIGGGQMSIVVQIDGNTVASAAAKYMPGVLRIHGVQ